jgi:RecB family exonuclease
MTWVAFEAAPIEAELQLAHDPQRAIKALHLVRNRLDVNQQGDSADPTAKPLRQAAQVRLTRSKLMIETER